MTASTIINEHIREQQFPLAELITRMHFENHPGLDLKYGKAGREKCEQDAVFHLSSLAESIGADSHELFLAYLEWAHGMLQSRKIPPEDLIDNLRYMDIACKKLLTSGDYHVITQYIAKGIHCIINIKPLRETFLTQEIPLQSYAERYLGLLLKGNRKPAQALIFDLVKKEHQSVPSVYEQIFKSTQYEVGLLWQTNKISVAHEHYCTAATTVNMASLNPYIPEPEKKGSRLLGCTISGDQHEIGIRMVSDFFEMDGWETYYMGANMPDINIISAAKEQRVNVLAISVTMLFYVSRAEKLIHKIRNDEELCNLKIIVGGYPFSLVPGLWHRIGADGSASNGYDAVALANGLVS